MNDIKKVLVLLFVIFSNAFFADEGIEKKFTVAFAQDTLSSEWRLAQVTQMKTAFNKYPNVEFVYTDGEGETSKQIYDIKQLLRSNIDLLITSPRNSKMMTPIISEVYSKIPVVLITRKTTNEQYTAMVAPDDYQIATIAAHTMAKALKSKGKVLMLRGLPTTTTAINREKGFLDTIKKYYPNISISSIRNGNYLRVDAVLEINKAIKEGEKFDGIYSHSDSMAVGARMALKKSNINVNSKIIIGIDYISEAKNAIISGEQYASFLYPTCAEETVEVVMKILTNKSYEKQNVIESVRITKYNVNKIEPIF